MWTLGEIALAVLITPGVCWLLYQLVESFGGLPPTEMLAAPHPPDTAPTTPRM